MEIRFGLAATSLSPPMANDWGRCQIVALDSERKTSQSSSGSAKLDLVNLIALQIYLPTPVKSSMSMNEIWEGAAASPFYPAVSKDRQFLAGSLLLLTGNFNHMEVGIAGLGSLTTASFYPDWIVRAQ